MSGPSFERITHALEEAGFTGRPAGTWTKYCCPIHEADGTDHDPSLGVKYLADSARSKVRCFKGCPDDQILAAVDLSVGDLYDTPRRQGGRAARSPRRPRPAAPSQAERAIAAEGLPLVKPSRELGRQRSSYRQTAAYTYTLPDGEVVGEVVRREARFEHGRDKKFFQRHWNPGAGRFENGGFPPVVFAAPQVRDAIEAGSTVFVVEGEKDALTGQRAGITATCNPGGAKNWTPKHAEFLRGANRVVIVADHDAAGYRHAETVAGTLTGLVGSVRIVTAATGKDLTEHIACGHEIAELRPVPGLDPNTPLPAGPVGEFSVAELAALSSGRTSEQMAEYMLAPDKEAAPVEHDDTTNMLGHHWSQLMRLIMHEVIRMAQESAMRRQQEEERNKRLREDAAREAEQQLATERKAIETRLNKMREVGFDKFSAPEIAAAVRDSAAWSEDSRLARATLAELAFHAERRFGVRIDSSTGEVATTASPEVSAALLAAEQERGRNGRLDTAQDRMVSLVAGDKFLSDEEREELYAEIEKWRNNPSRAQLDDLGRKLGEYKVAEPVKKKVRFVAAYLGTPNEGNEVGEMAGVATTELRRLGEPLVDPGEEAKPRIDALLARYQDRLKHGVNTDSVQQQLAHEVALLTEADQELTRARGREIRDDPAKPQAPLWPDHVDRDKLAADLRTYAVISPRADAETGQAGNLTDAAAASLRKQAAKSRKAVEKALGGEGLHAWEKDQIKAVLRDVSTGKTVTPDLLFIDDRSAAARDADRAAELAHDTTRVTRHQLDRALTSVQAPAGAERQARDAVTRAMDMQTRVASGQANLADWEASGRGEDIDARLAAAGAPEGLRNQVRNTLTDAASEAASVGKQARRVADVWSDRRDTVVESRAPKPDFDAPAWDSSERRAAFLERLRRHGVTPDVLEQRLAVDTAYTTPLSETLTKKPAAPARETAQGAGVSQVHHRNQRRGRGGPSASR